MSSSPSILILSGVRGDTRRYRTLHLHQQLRLAGVESKLSHLTDPQLPRLAEQAGALVLHRVAYDDYVTRLVAGVRRRGGLVVLDSDDLIFDPEAFQWIDSPDFRDPVRARLYREEMARHRQTLQSADAGLASTGYLAERMRALGKPTWVHRNAASLELARRSEQARQHPRPADGKLVLGYASGTPTHNRDFATIAPALMAALQARPELELWIIGYLDLDAAWDGLAGRIRRFAPVNWRALPAWLAQLDINLAPLVVENPFAQSKSEIKFMEAALVGVPTLAARSEAFSYAIRDGENGCLASGPDEWSAKLARLRQAEVRAALAANALAGALAEYSPQARARQAVAALNEIAAAAGRPFQWECRLAEGDPVTLDWPEEIERHPTFAEMGRYSLRHRGLATLAGQVWVFFRRWLARYIPYGGPAK